MFEFHPSTLYLIIIATALIPGLLISLGFFRKSSFHFLEKAVIGFTIGFCLVPLLYFFEFFFLGIKFSLGLVYANVGLSYVLGLAAFFLTGAHLDFMNLKLPAFPKTADEAWKAYALHVAPVLIILFTFLAFWIRVQSYGPIYQELDPYFYMYGARQILEDGAAPFRDDTAWYPLGQVNHRTAPLTSYLEAQWYALYSGGTENYYNYLLSVISSFYPPITAGLMVFFTYLLISQEYGRRHGLIAAAFATFVPITIIKMAAGVTELQSFNLFAMFFMFSSFALALKNKEDWRYYALTAFSVIVLLLGSNANQIMVLVIPSFIAIHALLLMYRGESLFHLMVLGFVYSITALFTDMLFTTYQIGAVTEIPYQYVFGLLVTLVFCAFPYFLQQKVKDRETRMYVIAAAVLACLALFVFTPLFSKFLDAGRGAVSTIVYEQPLTRTIQEQGAAGSSFEGEAGFLAANPGSVQIPFLPFLNGLVQFISEMFAVPSTIAINSLLSLADWTVGLVFGIETHTSQKAPSLGMVFLFGALLATISAFARTVFSKHDKRISHSDLFALYALMLFPISYVGLNRLKYTAFFAVMLVVAASFSIGEFDKLLNYLVRYISGRQNHPQEKKKTYVAFAFFAIFLLGFSMAVSSAFVPNPLGAALLSESMKTRYQDDPGNVAPKFQELCARIRLAGQSDDEICKAGSLDRGFLSDFNNQFSSRICYLSIVSDPFQGGTQYEQISGSFRCTRINPYWIQVMDWIEHNVSQKDRITSWWDYGHWTNFFGDKKTVLRNEHNSLRMIGMVASGFIAETPEELARRMNYFDSRYLMIDQEVISGGGYAFGGKFGALNYLSCAYLNQTSVANMPGQSRCEFEHTWESVYVPKNPEQSEICTISPSQNIRGIVAYSLTLQETPQGAQNVLSPTYCIGTAKMADGSINNAATYYLDRRNANGDLELNKANLIAPISETERFAVFNSFYTKDPIWVGEDGAPVSGWEDRKGKFYDSVLYQGFYLGGIPGFEFVYQTDSGEVKMFRLINFTSPLSGN